MNVFVMSADPFGRWSAIRSMDEEETDSMSGSSYSH